MRGILPAIAKFAADVDAREVSHVSKLFGRSLSPPAFHFDAQAVIALPWLVRRNVENAALTFRAQLPRMCGLNVSAVRH